MPVRDSSSPSGDAAAVGAVDEQRVAQRAVDARRGADASGEVMLRLGELLGDATHVCLTLPGCPRPPTSSRTRGSASPRPGSACRRTGTPPPEAVGWPATALADKRVTELTYESPADDISFTCGSWILNQPTTASQQREPAKTLVISGFTCQTVTAFSGYQQLSTHKLPVSLSPVVAQTPDGSKISGRIVAAQYSDVIVVAGSSRPSCHGGGRTGARTQAAAAWRVSGASWPPGRCPPTGARRSRPAAVQSAESDSGHRRSGAPSHPR